GVEGSSSSLYVFDVVPQSRPWSPGPDDTGDGPRRAPRAPSRPRRDFRSVALPRVARAGAGGPAPHARGSDPDRGPPRRLLAEILRARGRHAPQPEQSTRGDDDRQPEP